MNTRMLLQALVDQIAKVNPSDEHGHQFKNNLAYHRAVKFLQLSSDATDSKVHEDELFLNPSEMLGVHQMILAELLVDAGGTLRVLQPSASALANQFRLYQDQMTGMLVMRHDDIATAQASRVKWALLNQPEKS